MRRTCTYTIIFYIQSSHLPSTGDASEFYDGDGIYSEGRLRDAEDIAIYDTPTVQSGKKSKHLGTYVVL